MSTARPPVCFFQDIQLGLYLLLPVPSAPVLLLPIGLAPIKIWVVSKSLHFYPLNVVVPIGCLAKF